MPRDDLSMPRDGTDDDNFITVIGFSGTESGVEVYSELAEIRTLSRPWRLMLILVLTSMFLAAVTAFLSLILVALSLVMGRDLAEPIGLFIGSILLFFVSIFANGGRVDGRFYLDIRILPRIWALFPFILSHRIRNEIYEPMRCELEEDLVRAAKYRTKRSRQWICFCFALRTLLMIVECLRAAGWDRFTHLLLAFVPERVRAWIRARF